MIRHNENKKNDFLELLEKAFERGKQKETTIAELVEEIKINLKMLEIK